MDPPPPVPPPLPVPKSLSVSSSGSNTPSKKRGRPPGSRNRAGPATNGGGSLAEPNRPNLDTASNVISALKFPLPGPAPRAAPAAPAVKKAPSTSSSSSTSNVVAPPPVVAAPLPTNGRAPRASKVNANLRMVDAARRDTSPPPSPPTPKPAKVVPVAQAVPPPPPAKPVVVDPSAPSLQKNPAIAFRSLPKATPLDFKTVKTKGPRIPPPRTQPRAFGLTEAPTFYPSKEEFKNPMEYIRWCGSEGGAKEYGICKIVPPEGWQPPFVMDTETFRFKTRLMRINSMEAKSRAKINFLEQLFIYHQQQGNADISTPLVDHKEVDLWLLRKEVTQAGGFNEVTRRKMWTEVAKKLGYAQAFAQQIKVIYSSLVFPFDEFAVRARSGHTASPLPANKSPSGGGMRPNNPAARSSAALGASNSTSNLSTSSGSTASDPPYNTNAVASGSGTSGGSKSAPASPGRGPTDTKDPSGIKRSLNFEDADSSLSEAESEGEEKKREEKKRKIPSRRAAMNPLNARPPATKLKPSPMAPQNAPKGDLCEVCWKGNAATKILLCDACDAGFHIYCLDPPLPAVPKNESWYCSACLFGTGNEYGFDEGEDHSITSFQKRDTAFREHWFNTHPVSSQGNPALQSNGLSQKIGKKVVSEHDIETEFWRLVESEEETVEVEYGADVHSTIHGSAAPTFETHPLDPYSIDQWNLNNMPILPGSVLRYIKSNISGMTVPWIYIGFIFSCFAWHNEDHYTSSVNYMHFGETKTWYGIPGDDAGKFEAAIKQEAPDLFEQQPALLFQLITLMNPGRVQKAGVRVFACDQRANEFVITFPKAYHSGFNHGLNYNEAVNFARPDWLEFGRECVENYRSYSKAPVFDHNELLISIAEHSHTIDTSIWLEEPLREMITHEMAARDRLRAQLSTEDVPLREIVEEVDRPEEEYQCSVCKAFTYLSQVICPCTKSVACLEHAAELCSCASSSRTLRNRFSKESLFEIQDTIISRSAIPELWTLRFHRILSDNPQHPNLKALRSLVADGERIGHPVQDLDTLTAFVNRANELLAQAATFLTKKPKGRKYVPRSKIKRDADDVEMGDPEEEPFSSRSPEAVYQLLGDIYQVGFEAPEINSLEALYVSASKFQDDVHKLLPLTDADQSLKDLDVLLRAGQSLNLDLPELDQLEKIVGRLRWNRDLGTVDESSLDVKQIDDYLRMAKENGIPSSHRMVIALEKRQVVGHAWRDEAKKELGGDRVTIDTLNRLLERADESPIDVDILSRVRSLRNKAIQWDKEAKQYLDSVAEGYEGKPATIVDLRRLLKRVEAKGGCIATSTDLLTVQNEVQAHDAWNVALAKLLPDSKNRLKDLETILDNVRERTYPEDDEPSPLINASKPPAKGQDDKSDAGDEEGEEAGAVVGPIQRYSCVCRQPEEHPMLKCKTCGATYHGDCVEVSARSVKAFKRYQCVVCDPKKLDAPRNVEPKLSSFTSIIQAHDYGWFFPPAEHVFVIKIVHKSIRFLEVVSGHLQPQSRRNAPVDEVEVGLLRHYLRKVDQLAIDLEVLSADGDILDVRNTLLQALQIVSGRPGKSSTKKRAREGKPHWEMTVIHKADGNPLLHCLCSNLPKTPELVVVCKNERCGQVFHVACVCVPPEATKGADFKFKCPLCCLKTGTRYPFAECRLQMEEHVGTLVYVDIPATLLAIDQLKTVVLPKISSPGIVLWATSFTPGIKSDAGTGAEQPKKKKQKTTTTTKGGGKGEASGSKPRAQKSQPSQQKSQPHSNQNGNASASTSALSQSHPQAERQAQVERTLSDIKAQIREQDPNLSEDQIDDLANDSAAPMLEGSYPSSSFPPPSGPSSSNSHYSHPLPPPDDILPIPQPLTFNPPPPPSKLLPSSSEDPPLA